MSWIILKLISAYQYFLSPFLGKACRFHPSCSCYMREAVEKHGAFQGTLMGAARLCRCHPFHEGGLDPVPDKPIFQFNKQ